ncbi:MAG: hypothetical protein M3317_12120 [Actinomycetota bacterium]|nr:hypothetical protein [Actinomycetota bacterium]
MISDLLHALPATLLVGVLPGWLWMRCLLASGDRAEQLAYTVALSITLVPAVALAQTYLFATGVTLAVTIASAALVFLAGLGAYLLFGPAKGPKEPLSRPPSPPSLPTLAPLVAGLALALLMFLGIAPGEWLMIPIGILVLAAGIVYWSTEQGRDAAELQEEDRRPVPAAVRYALLSLVLVLVLARGYMGPVVNGWPYPRGVDRYEHAVMAGMMMRSGSNESFMLYPPGFHLLTAMISRLSGFEPLEVFPILAPTLPFVCALACYALARRLWGWEYGVVAALTSGLLLGSTYLNFEEARYPNFIGEYFLIVLAVGAVVGMYASPSARNGLLLALLGSSTVLYHQIAGYSLAVLLGFVSLLFLPYLLLRDRRKGVYLLVSLALLGLLSVLYAWDTYDLPSLVAGMLGGSETGRGGEAVAMAIGTKPANGPGHFLSTLSHPVLWLGLFGLLLMLAGSKNARGTPDILARLSLLLWTLLLFFGSLTSYSGFPDRFERDLGVPLALLAALALVTVLRASPRPGERIAFAAALSTIVLSVTLVGVQSIQSLKEATGPSTRPKDRPPPAEVVAAGAWLKRHNDGGSIIATPYFDYVPSRAMLAMGGYTRMQSYDAARIRRARDLPPFGAGPLWDALWVLQHPAGERTARLLEKNDVRYVVFYRRYPWVDRRPFAQHEDLYRTVFENDRVIIFAPRHN